MFLDLPSDIVYHIVSFLSTASCVHNLALTCRRLHEIISAGNYRIFQAFVQSRFESIDVPPFWVDAARALTSRSRAFDRKAIIGRFVLPPQNARRIGHPRTVRTDHPTLGYRPVIDSYEVWCGNNWHSRKEVLVWGAGADLNIRVTDLSLYGKNNKREHRVEPDIEVARHRRSIGRSRDGVTWAVFNDLHGVNSWDDIAGVHAVPSTYGEPGTESEDIIFGRRNGSLLRMAISPGTGSSVLKKRYITGESNSLEKTDLSAGPQRLLAATLGRRAIAFFRADAEEDELQPLDILKTTAHGFARHKCSRLLCDERIAVGSDSAIDTIRVYDLTPTGVTRTRDFKMDDSDEGGLMRKSQVQTIEPLPVTSRTGGRAGDLFLAGWEDSKVRLHDLRSPKPYVSSYIDTVDDSLIYVIQPIGRECFLVGSGINATVKFFDMRMPNRYSYLDARPAPLHSQNHQNHHYRQTSNGFHNFQLQNVETPASEKILKDSLRYPRRDVSVFLSNRPPVRPSNRAPLFRDNLRYRGPIYTMSVPSPSSSTVYVGVEANVIRLDFASTDDITGPHRQWYEQNLGLGLDVDATAYADANAGIGNHLPVHSSSSSVRPFDLSCYERPLPEDRGKGVKLMMQHSLHKVVGSWERDGDGANQGRVPGWDPRWWQPLVKGKKRVRGRRTRA
ncbi:F-box domain-containing protein [Blastomyces gilchristii SLH14081]|uniref:F-box domain-containing protein n=1 Tax=Blastomyces gilchristii (strain SLH14081) TaxID=559298 RepID=A0A179V0Y6_BLAGS|nr:F-box domain-containing protein [Blastomyces gilchristii SLH14081]OAT13713.1 F-box domain-containing protein [Blastomyces gilchristii SLH14081]